jgi:hypothetical protein
MARHSVDCSGSCARPSKDQFKSDSLLANPVGITRVDPIQWMPADRAERVDRYYTEIEEVDQ